LREIQNIKRHCPYAIKILRGCLKRSKFHVFKIAFPAEGGVTDESLHSVFKFNDHLAEEKYILVQKTMIKKSIAFIPP
jgi:hypothetical protein